MQSDDLYEDIQELTTSDLLDEPPGLPGLASAGVSVSVTAATSPNATAAPAPPNRPRFVPSALSRPIREKSRSSGGAEVKSRSGNESKAQHLFEEAIEAEQAGDPASALRHVKLALVFNPSEPRYRALLDKLQR